ncbi:hypothetical protein DAEQUDRAFT_764810 [Daedalea quercina L-15889]|uniref:CASTOR ACT domain-containing protein n=1 Tax=Daedalea quercina L-15889 TaxID=1314783 RepID=A0A165R6N1_9APHY|nr:hypothetical protein DAEQUDRAFT_764810 [Daedalea quercina L-15889]
MSDSVTISLLPVSLALVHVPRSRLDTLTQHVLRQILRPNPSFLNVTCNEIELSLFAEGHALREFQKIAHKDARKLRRMRGTQSPSQPGRKTRSGWQRQDWEPIEVSSDRWSVLQIDSHSDSLDNSGARVRELSAPLAAAGISILYQSSYMSDFIFVKSARLSQVTSLLATAGFDLYSDNPDNLTAQVSTFTSPLLSPTQDDASVSLLDLSSVGGTANSVRVDPGGGAVFTRSRSSTVATNSSSGSRAPSILQMSSPHDFSPEPTSPASPITFDVPAPGGDDADADTEAEADDALTKTPAPGPAPRPAMARSQSHSPSGCDVSVLVPDLTYVGLSDEHAEMWGLKIVKLVAYPDLIAGVVPAAHSRSSSSESAGSNSPLSPLEPAAAATVDAAVKIADAVSRMERGNESGSDTTTRLGAGSDKEDVVLFEHTEQTMPWEEDLAGDAESSDEDGYFSSSPQPSQPDLVPGARPSLTHYDTVDTVHPAGRSRSDSSSSTSASSASSSTSPIVPFFSFTRTSEGSSLTAPVSLLAALFPPHERDMVICSDELYILDSRQESPEADEDEENEDDDRTPLGPLRCLQIDLRKFGLDKHGLVNRFSRTLEENGINHMYNSTYKTANLLVDKAHASRAQALLRLC